MVSTVQAVRTAMSRLERTLSSTASRADVAREIEYFRTQIGKVRQPSDVTDDQRLLRFVTEAFGVGEMRTAAGFVRRLITDGMSSGGLGDRLLDQRFRDLAATFDFRRLGANLGQTRDVVEGVPARFVRQRVEQEAGQTNPAVRLALYFDRTAPTVQSRYGVLADQRLLDVVLTATGVPNSVRSLDIERQARMLEDRVDVGSWKRETARSAFLERFAAQYDLGRATSTTSASEVRSGYLFAGSSVLDASVLLGLQVGRRGR